MLRQFKKGGEQFIFPPLIVKPLWLVVSSDDLQGRSISSLSVFPNKAKGYLLVLALPSLHEIPSTTGKDAQYAAGINETAAAATMTSSMLKIYDLGSYRYRSAGTYWMIHNYKYIWNIEHNTLSVARM